MDIKCPSCRKRNTSNSSDYLCKRCGGDLSKLFEIVHMAQNKMEEARRAFLNELPGEAMILAEESWRLKHSSEAAKLAFLASVGKKEYMDAYKWYQLGKSVNGG